MLCMHGTSHAKIAKWRSVLHVMSCWRSYVQWCRDQPGTCSAAVWRSSVTIARRSLNQKWKQIRIVNSMQNFSARHYASVVYAMGLCPCLSVTCRCCTKTAKHGITQQQPTDSSFLVPKISREIRPRSPPTGAPDAGGVGQNRRLSTNNRLYHTLAR